MKPNRPQVISSSRNYITLSWDNCDLLKTKYKEKIKSANLKEDEKEEKDIWYILERRNRVLGWCRTYMGFKTLVSIGPLAPGDYYEFRLKVTTGKEESEWSETLFAATKDDIVSASYLHRVVENGPVTTLRKILNQRPSSVDVPNKFGQTALRLGIVKNNTNFMGILLNYGADIEHKELGSERTPLMMAAQMGQLEAVQLLLERGASWDTKDRNGLTAFNYAVDNSYFDIVELGVECNANINTKDRFGWTPLMRGVTLKSSLKVLNCLLENGSNPNEADNMKQTVLMQAVLSGRPEVVKLLLRKGASIDERNVYGHSAYEMAKGSDNEEILNTAHLLTNEPEEELRNKRKNPELQGENKTLALPRATL